jgi:hypothetical protein
VNSDAQPRTRTPKLFIENRSRNLSSTSTLTERFVRDVEDRDPNTQAPRNSKTESRDLAPRKPAAFIEDPTKRSSARSRALASTKIPLAERRGNPKTTRGPPAPDALAGVEPAFVSIKFAAVYMAESQWTIKNRLRLGQIRARKSGRRTLIEFSSLKAMAQALPAASFAPVQPRKRETPIVAK